MALHIVPSLVGRLSLGKHAVLPALGNLVCRRPSGTQPRIRPQIHKHSHGIALKSYRQPSAAMTRCAYSGELSEPTNRINAHETSKKLLLGGIFAAVAPSAGAQIQTAGPPGSAGATTTIGGKQLPAPSVAATSDEENKRHHLFDGGWSA